MVSHGISCSLFINCLGEATSNPEKIITKAAVKVSKALCKYGFAGDRVLQ